MVRYRSDGVHRFVLARTMGAVGDVDGVRDALGGAALTVVRLEVSAEVAAARVRARAGGGAVASAELASQAELWSASSVLDADLVVPNQDAAVGETAARVLAHLSAAQHAGQWAMPTGE